VHSLFTRLPPLSSLNRTRVLIGVTTLLWIVDLASNLLLTLATAPASDSLHWQSVIASLLIEYLLLLPLLILCYAAATRIPRLIRQPLLGALAHGSLAAFFVVMVRVAAFVGFYVMATEADLAGTHYRMLLRGLAAPMDWYDDVLLNVTYYLLGLFMIIGVNARLDLRNERERAADLHARWLKARLDTLRGQLNPHFLFNSLHTISALLYTDVHRADKLLADFSDVLRISLREGQREFSTVREELDYARRYLSIEETRFEDRLVTRFEVDEASLGVAVPSLILQPLIENAIKHGISNSTGPNTVVVRASGSEAALVLEVSNDFRVDAAPVSADRSMGIGLTNVRERLAAIYGGDFTLSSRPLPGHRWSTLISLPYPTVHGG